MCLLYTILLDVIAILVIIEVVLKQYPIKNFISVL